MGTNHAEPSVTPTADRDGRQTYAIELDSTVVGRVTLTVAGPGCLRVSGEVAPSFRGKGIATAALAAVCELLARSPARIRLIARVDLTDGAAHRVLESNGFVCADVGRHPLLFERTVGG